MKDNVSDEGDIIALTSRHPIVGTWRDQDTELGSSVRFTVRALGSSFDVRAVDTHDGEEIDVSKVRWDGRTLKFCTFVRSSGWNVEYELETISRDEVSLRLSYAERWVRTTE